MDSTSTEKRVLVVRVIALPCGRFDEARVLVVGTFSSTEW